MQEKIQKLIILGKKYELHDVRTIGVIIFCFIALAVTWNGIKAVQLNYELQQRVTKLQQENEVLQLEIATDRLRADYYTTEEYQELEARRVLGKAAPGERLFIVSPETALSKTKTSPPAEQSTGTVAQVTKSKYQQNFEDWMDFFLHRDSEN